MGRKGEFGRIGESELVDWTEVGRKSNLLSGLKTKEEIEMTVRYPDPESKNSDSRKKYFISPSAPLDRHSKSVYPSATPSRPHILNVYLLSPIPSTPSLLINVNGNFETTTVGLATRLTEAGRGGDLKSKRGMRI